MLRIPLFDTDVGCLRRSTDFLLSCVARNCVRVDYYAISRFNLLMMRLGKRFSHNMSPNRAGMLWRLDEDHCKAHVRPCIARFSWVMSTPLRDVPGGTRYLLSWGVNIISSSREVQAG